MKYSRFERNNDRKEGGIALGEITPESRCLDDMRTLELGQALFDVAGVFTNCVQHAADVAANLGQPCFSAWRVNSITAASKAS